MLETRPIFIFENGDIYEGQWNIATNKPEGHGASIIGIDDELFEGNFIEGKLNGHGRGIYKNGTVYVGQWKDGKQCGQGVKIIGPASHAAGHRQEGQYKND